MGKYRRVCMERERSGGEETKMNGWTGLNGRLVAMKRGKKVCGVVLSRCSTTQEEVWQRGRLGDIATDHCPRKIECYEETTKMYNVVNDEISAEDHSQLLRDVVSCSG
jgi:hypothetical protein